MLTPPLLARLGLKDSFRLSEINAASQFPHHHNVYSIDDFPLQGRCFHQLGQNCGWTQVGEQLKTGSQSQQPRFRTLVTG